MKRTNLYIEVSSVSPRKSEKQYGYIIEAESNGHPVTVGDFGKAEGSYHLVTLTALIEALKRYQKPSEIHIYCPNDYVLGQFRNIKTWLKNDFKTVKGNTDLPILHQNVLISYLKNDIFSAVDIPYGNGMWTMTVMLPNEGKTTDDVISLLAANGWSTGYLNNPMAEARPYEVDLKLPRFDTSSDTDELPGDLIGVLKKMGIQRMFSDDLSELPNLCEEHNNVYISKMRQKAKITVNEEGSEAAAVTVAEALDTSAGPMDLIEIPKANFHATKPFVYLIRESSTGIILFVGKYTGE